MEGEESKRAAVLNRFLCELLDDRESGTERPLAEYLARFPGFEEDVRAEHARLLAAGPAADPARPRIERFGAYRVLAELGRGGQGEVFLAEDTRLGRRVALKLLPGLSLLTREGEERFRREAAMAARLDHPGIATVYESGLQDGVPFVAMRHVEGETLAAVLARRRERGERSDVGEALATILQAARAVHAAHEAGVLHRDVKPANLMLARDGGVVVLDFGLARDLEAGATITQSGDVFGTPSYMAPEQIEGRRADRRTDVWALGVCLHEALVLAPPFRAATREALYHAVLTERPEDPRRVHPGVSRDLAVVVATALAKDPDGRYATAADLARDLEAVRDGRAIAARAPGTLERLWRWARREPGRAALAAGLSAALLGVAGIAGYLLARAPELEAGSAVLRARERERLVSRVLGRAGNAIRRAEDEAALRSILVEDPRLASQWATLADYLVGEGRPEDALALLGSAPADSDDPRLIDRLRVGALRVAGREDEARALEAGLGEPVSAMESYFTSRQLRGTDPRRAFELARRAIFLAPEPEEFFFHELLQSGGEAELPELELAAEVLERRYADSPLSWVLAATAWSFTDPARAEAAAAHARELDPSLPQPYVMLAGSRMVEGDFEAATELFEAGIALTEPGSRERLHLLSARARWLTRFDFPEQALETLERVLAEDPASLPVLLQRAELLAGLERLDEAAEAFGRVLDVDPGNARARQYLGL